VSLTAVPVWRIRLVREAPRAILCLLALAGVAACVRLALDPPVRGARSARPAVQPADRAAEGYAVLFARRYLTWDAAEPQASAHSLSGFVGPGMEPRAGLVPPPGAAQRVEWAEVVQAREPATGDHVYTVAAQTDGSGLVYLAVGVQRAADGSLALSGYPAFVGPPTSEQAHMTGDLTEVTDPTLTTVLVRALRNYLAGASGELAADLTGGARVSLPGIPLTLESVERLDWAPDHSTSVAVIQAVDGRGAQYTLEYEVDVAREQGRWEIAAIQMDPYA